MNTNSEDEIFSILKPVETCLAEDDKARLWARIRKDSLRMRAFRRAAVIAVSSAAAIVAGVAIISLGQGEVQSRSISQRQCRKQGVTSGLRLLTKL